MANRISISTRRGDGGQTDGGNGARVSKASAQIQAMGELDELNSWIGYARSLQTDDTLSALLLTVQQDLFAVGTLLMRFDRTSPELASLTANINRLEQEIHTLENSLPPLRMFLLPGGPPPGSSLHVARAICRRAERSVAALHSETDSPSQALPYLNRLSDLLFLLARSVNKSLGYSEAVWTIPPHTGADDKK
jgi:cob(I)alamin adenosyltransferase